MKHEESTLHLQFCKKIKKHYPDLAFIRHEREKQRSKFLGGLMKVYNSVDGIADFELIEPVSAYFGLYIEFKKPGEEWQVKGVVKAKYQHQYLFHQQAWNRNRPAYFCNDLDAAWNIFLNYINGTPLPMQKYSLPLDKNAEQADEFFNEYNSK